MCFWTEWSDVIGSELLYIPHSLYMRRNVNTFFNVKRVNTRF